MKHSRVRTYNSALSSQLSALSTLRHATSALILLVAVVSCSPAWAQNTFPPAPPVGIGTEIYGPGGSRNALQIHYDPTSMMVTKPAVLRLSQGTSTSTDTCGLLAFVHDSTGYSSLAAGFDLILHENKQGDLILNNYWPSTALTHASGGAIRFATAGDTTRQVAPPIASADFERMMILANGNIGMNLPKDSVPYEQFQIGGGTVAPAGLSDPVPGLTIYGGNRYEGMALRSGGSEAIDWRGISFNHYQDHWVTTGGLGKRFARMSSSGIGFSQDNGGLVHIGCSPYDAGRGIDDFSAGMHVDISGQKGMEVWCDDSAAGGSTYHHLFDVWRPGFSDSHNITGMFLVHTPMYIGGSESPDSTRFPNVHPRLSDGKTWKLAVNGPALFKEAYVSTEWPDYVFDSSYTLRSLSSVEKYIKANNHLPDVPSADEIASTGVALGATEAKLLQKIEELTLYTIELSKRIDAQQAEIKELRKEK